MDINFSRKRVLVSGAAAGIGRGIAHHLTKCNATVVALDISKEHLDILKKELPSVETVVVDLTDWKATETAVKSVLPIDLLVNNAGIASLEAVTSITEESFNRYFNIHVKATVHLSKLVVQDLLARKVPGAIVNISSIASKVGLGLGTSLYSAAKGSVEAFTRGLAVELGPNNIRVNSVHPTMIKTNLTRTVFSMPQICEKVLDRMPLHRFPEPQDVADAVAFLLSDRARNITGSMLPVDCGYLCA